MLRVPSGILGPPGPAQNRLRNAQQRGLVPARIQLPRGRSGANPHSAWGRKTHGDKSIREAALQAPSLRLEARLILLLLEMYRNLIQLLHFLPGSVPGPSSARADPAAVCESVRWGGPSCPGRSLTPMWQRGHLSPRPVAIREGTEPMPVPFTGQEQSQGRDENFRKKWAELRGTRILCGVKPSPVSLAHIGGPRLGGSLRRSSPPLCYDLSCKNTNGLTNFGA